MKVLLVHNYYGSSSPSGENLAFEAECALLRAHGHEVDCFVRHSDEIRAKGVLGKINGALSTPWNPWMASAIRQKVAQFEPDVVHVHNTFPLLSPAIFRAVGKGSARLLTLHNYRLFCAAAIPMRDGRVCTECLDNRSAWPAIRYGCYRDSRVATLPLAASVSLHRALGTWTGQVDAFIALTSFQRDRMIEAGLPNGLTHVKPNFYPGAPLVVPWGARRRSVVFAGRLTAEKGVVTLVKSWLMWGPSAPELRILGDGGLREDLKRLASTAPDVPIRFLGQVANEAAKAEIAHARLLVLPSQCFEGFPMVLGEAFAFGTPAAVSRIGPLPDIVKHGVSGVVFRPGDATSLANQVRRAWDAQGLLERLAKNARTEFATKYTEDVNYHTLMKIYGEAISVSRDRAVATA